MLKNKYSFMLDFLSELVGVVHVQVMKKISNEIKRM